MSWELIKQEVGTKRAGEDMTSARGRAVVFNGLDRWQIAGLAGPLAGQAHGVLTNNPASGDVATVQVFGVVEALLGGPVTGGRYLDVDANGALIENNPEGQVGVALESGIAGSIIAVLLVNRASAGSAPTAHGTLLGLAADDHPQYHDGSLAYTGALDMGTFDIGNVGLVDGIDVSVLNATVVANALTMNNHIADGTLHFTEASINHANILNIGSNSHAAIDTHIADATIHWADAPNDGMSYVRNSLGWQLETVQSFGEYSGVFDASIGTFPVTLNQGDWFNCTVAGTVDGQNFIVGDILVALVDTPSTVTFAANWSVIPNISVTDHTLLTNIGTNSHAAIDLHIADTDIHFSDAPADATDYVRNNNAWVAAAAALIVQEEGVPLATAADTLNFVGAGCTATGVGALKTITIPGGVTDHGALTGLADDDHLQYLLLAGRAGGQSAFGGTVNGQRLDLQGSSAADRGTIGLNGATAIDFDWTTDVGSYAMRWANTIPASGGVIAGLIQVANNVTINNALFISSTVDDNSLLEWTVAPGFAVNTLFFARPTLLSTTNGVPPAQSFLYAAQAQYHANTCGSVTVPNYRGFSFAPIIRAETAGDAMNITNTDGLTVGPLYNTRNATATANFGTIRGVHMLNAGPILFGQALGSEIADAWIGVDCEALTGLVVSGRKAAVRSAIASGANNRFIENLSTANSDMGSGHAFFRDGFGLGLGGPYNNTDVLMNWQAAGYLRIQFISTGDDLRLSSPSADRFLFDNVGGNATGEYNFNCSKFSLGAQTGAVGNQVGVFATPARATEVNGGWADFLLTHAGNLTIDDTMSDVSGWVINPISLTIGTGSITGDVATLRVGMTTSSLGGARTAAIYHTGRRTVRGVDELEPLSPAAITATVNNYAPATGNAMRQVWRLTTDDLGVRTITGIAVQQRNDTQWVTNVGTTDNIILSHQDAGSTAGNRIISPTGANLTLAPDDSALLWHDDVTDRWRVMFTTGA